MFIVIGLTWKRASASVPELTVEGSALGLHSLGDLSPGLQLSCGIDARDINKPETSKHLKSGASLW